MESVIKDNASIEKFIPNELKIGFIGAGNMARSLIKGLLLKNQVGKDRLTVSAPTDRNRDVYTQLGVNFTHDNQVVLNDNHVVFLAVKPYLMKDVLSELDLQKTGDKLIISVAAGVSMDSHLNWIGNHTNFARLMPTVPIEVGAGICGICLSPTTHNNYKNLLLKLFEGIAVCEEMTDSQIELMAALGSGTAFMYECIQGLTYGAVKMGLPLHIASRLTPQVALGAAKVIQESGKHPAELADCIFSPGGTTIHGFHALTRGGLKSAMMDAFEAAVLRAKEMSEQNK